MAINKTSVTSLAIVQAMQALSAILGAAPAALIDRDGEEFIFGAVMEETESFSARISQHAIEGEENVADHVHPEPGSFTIKTTITNDNCLLSSLSNYGLSLFGLGTKTASEKIDLLKWWRKTGKLLNYSGPAFANFYSEAYDIIKNDLVISRLDIRRTAKQGVGVQATVSLQEAQVVFAEYEELGLSDSQAYQKSLKSKGKSATKKEKKKGGVSSMLKKLTG